MPDNTLKIKRRGDDGYKVISVRIKEDTLEALDKLAGDTNYSRNELINLLLKHGVDNAVGTVLVDSFYLLVSQREPSHLTR